MIEEDEYLSAGFVRILVVSGWSLDEDDNMTVADGK